VQAQHPGLRIWGSRGDYAMGTIIGAVIGTIIGALIIGLVCGAIASAIVPGRTPGGIIGVILVGIVGGFLGNILFGAIGLGSSWWLGSIIVGIIGAVIVLLILRWVQGRRGSLLVEAQDSPLSWIW